MKEKSDNDLTEILELNTEIIRIQKRNPETTSAYCAEVRSFFCWRAECRYQPGGSRWVTSQDAKPYLNNHKRFNPPIACNRTLSVLRSSFAFGTGSMYP
jgi:hypothetical protein